MGKSLTEVAKSILTEGAYPSVTPDMHGKFDRDAKSTTTAKSSLRPASGYKEGEFSNSGSSKPTAPDNSVEDLGPALVKNTDTPPTAKAAGKMGKDTSGSSQSRKGTVAAEKSKKQTEVMEEDYELDEVLDTANKKMEYIEKAGKQIMDYEPYKDRDGKGADRVRKRTKGAQMLQKKIAKKGVGPVDEGSQENKMKKNAAIAAMGDEKEYSRMNPEVAKLKSGRNKLKMEEEIEISEELEAFINEMIEEGYSEAEIAAAIDENFEIVDLNEEEFEEDYEVDMSEHVEALFAGEELSEEFKQKAIAIFEAAVKQKVEEELAVIEEAYAETLEEQIEQIQEELSENVDSYLGYVVEQWMNENEVAIEAGLRTELTEDFISGLRNLFAEHYIDIPEDKVSVVEEMAEKVVELESKLDEEIDRNVFLTKALNESAQNEILLNACAGLTEVQSEKLKSLAEGVDYSSIDEFENKINILRESYFNNNVRTNNVLDSNYVDTESNMLNESLSGPMAVYVRTLGKTLPR